MVWTHNQQVPAGPVDHTLDGDDLFGTSSSPPPGEPDLIKAGHVTHVPASSFSLTFISIFEPLFLSYCKLGREKVPSSRGKLVILYQQRGGTAQERVGWSELLPRNQVPSVSKRTSQRGIISPHLLFPQKPGMIITNTEELLHLERCLTISFQQEGLCWINDSSDIYLGTFIFTQFLNVPKFLGLSPFIHISSKCLLKKNAW